MKTTIDFKVKKINNPKTWYGDTIQVTVHLRTKLNSELNIWTDGFDVKFYKRHNFKKYIIDAKYIQSYYSVIMENKINIRMDKSILDDDITEIYNEIRNKLSRIECEMDTANDRINDMIKYDTDMNTKVSFINKLLRKKS
jgi:hypothetical protein